MGFEGSYDSTTRCRCQSVASSYILAVRQHPHRNGWLVTESLNHSQRRQAEHDLKLHVTVGPNQRPEPTAIIGKRDLIIYASGTA